VEDSSNNNDNIREIQVQISEDKMEAAISISKPDSSEDNYTKSEIMSKLSEIGIKTGIDEDKIIEMITNKQYGQFLIIASGKQVEHGKDGYYEYFFDVDSASQAKTNKPNIRSDGSIDFLNKMLFVKVKEGDLLCKYHEPTKGNFGFDVFGKLLVPKPGKPAPRIRGKGFIISNDGLEYYAMKNGKVEFRNYDLNISDIYEVNGDVDLSTGNIDFDGDVIINGNVKSGVNISAMGNIFISGFVEDANLRAKKDIIIKAGCNTKGLGRFVADGSIQAKFFENANVYCKGDIKVEYILNCTVVAYGKVFVSGGRGSIIGGDITGVLGIETQYCGHETNVKTVLRVGATKEIRHEYAECIMKIKEIDTSIDTFDQALEKISLLKEAASDKYDKEMEIRIFQSKIVKKAEKTKEEERSKMLFGLIRESERSVLKIEKSCYQGCRIILNDKSYIPSSVFDHILVKKVMNNIKLLDYDDE